MLGVVGYGYLTKDDNLSRTGTPVSGPVAVEKPEFGGELTGQAASLGTALTGRGLECGVRFTSSVGGMAGCFGFDAKGNGTTEVVFQFQPDGTVIGLNAQVTGETDAAADAAFEPMLDQIAPTVFPEDRAKITTAFGTTSQNPEATATGSWGQYEVRSLASKASISAAKSGARPLRVPNVNLDIAPQDLVEGLMGKGFSCPTEEDCERVYSTGEGKLKVSFLSAGPTSIAGLNVWTVDQSKTTSAAANRTAFAGLVDTVYGLVQEPDGQQLNGWVDQHRDDKSHTAYVNGWRVDLTVARGTPWGQQDIPTRFELRIFSDGLWSVPGQ